MSAEQFRSRGCHSTCWVVCRRSMTVTLCTLAAMAAEHLQSAVARDRFGNTPVDEAEKSNNQLTVAKFINAVVERDISGSLKISMGKILPVDIASFLPLANHAAHSSLSNRLLNETGCTTIMLPFVTSGPCETVKGDGCRARSRRCQFAGYMPSKCFLTQLMLPVLCVVCCS